MIKHATPDLPSPALRALWAARAENDRLRAALHTIDSIATRHEAGAAGKMQKVARDALAKEGP